MHICKEFCYNKYRLSRSSFQMFVGIIVCIELILILWFISKLKRLSLLPLKHIQIIIIFLLSRENLNEDLIDFTSLLTLFNFNLEFLSPNSLNQLLSWYNESRKMQNFHYNCTSTLTNYKMLIVMSILGIMWYFGAKLLIVKFKFIKDVVCLVKEIKILR